jgi:hypothetical protein
MLTLLLSLHLLGGPVPPRAPVHYHLTNRVSVEMTMMPAPIVLLQSAYVTISLTDSAAGQVARVVIDSSTFDAGQFGAAMAGQMAEDPKGVTLHAYIVNGRALSIDPSAPNVQALQLIPALQLLFSGTRAAKSGDSWVDSTLADTTASSAVTKASVITSWKASSAPDGATQLDGTVTGTMTMGAGAMQLEIQTTGSSHVTSRARQLPTSATASNSGQGNMNAGGQAIPMKVSTDLSATLIP